MPLDKIDLMIMEQLEDDARQSIRALAIKLGLKRSTVAYHLNKLTTEGILTIACVGNPEFMGYQFMLVIGINVSPGKAETVANQLIPLQAVKIVSLTVGKYNILAWAVLRDRLALARLISENLTKISDITTIEMIHSFHWMRDSWRYFKSQMEIPRRCPQDTLSDMDFSIIRAMEIDPRQTVTKLAETVDCSKSVAKARLEKLVDNGFIRFVSVVDPTALGYDIGVVVLIKCRIDAIYDVANKLSVQNTARHVSLITGQWHIFVAAQFRDSGHMYEFVSETLAAIPGVIEFEVVHLAKNLKFNLSILDSGDRLWDVR